MDNSANGCNGNVHSYNGYCTNDMFIRFEDKLGRNCQSRWLVNNWRWKYGRLGKNEQDIFDYTGRHLANQHVHSGIHFLHHP